MGKILLYLSIAFSIGTAAVGFVNHGTLVQTKDDLASTQGTLESTKNTLTKTEADLTKTKQELAATTTEKESLTTQLSTATQKATTAEAKVAEQTTQLTEKDATIAQNTTDIAAKDAKIKELETGPAGGEGGTSTQVTDLQSQLAEKEALITTLQTNDAASKAQIADYRKQADDRQKQQMRTGLEGRVLAVNTAWNFVVLSLGDRNGIVNNAEMLVKRGTQLIGKVKITSVEPSSSIADIVSNSSGNVTIQPGDNVIYKGNE